MSEVLNFVYEEESDNRPPQYTIMQVSRKRGQTLAKDQGAPARQVHLTLAKLLGA